MSLLFGTFQFGLLYQREASILGFYLIRDRQICQSLYILEVLMDSFLVYDFHEVAPTVFTSFFFRLLNLCHDRK
jgi:hypothetical protein